MPRPSDRTAALAAVAAHRNGASYVDIANAGGFSREWARQLCLRGAEIHRRAASTDPADELSARARNAIISDGCDPSPEAVAAHYQSTANFRTVPNLGVKTITEIEIWLIRHGQWPNKDSDPQSDSVPSFDKDPKRPSVPILS